MKKQIFFLLMLFLFWVSKSMAQDPSITTPKLIFDGRRLVISYDVTSKSQSDKFFVWVEMEKKNGARIEPKALSGDIGEIKAGKDKKITWIPEMDSVIIYEEVSVEVKAEKYVELFHKGNLVVLSTVVPGLGQTKISKGKPYWLTGIAAYATLAGGFVFHSGYIKSYDKYGIEEDAVKRADLYNQAQSQMSVSRILLGSAAAIWAANIIWITVIPDKYKPLKHLSFSLEKSPISFNQATLLTMRIQF